MIKIRRGIFETNSSSTHSLSIADIDDFNKWVKGEILFDKNNDSFITKEEAIKQIKEDKYYQEEDLSDPDIIEELMRDEEVLTYEQYFDNDYLESFEQKYTTRNGDKIVAFGVYGHD